VQDNEPGTPGDIARRAVAWFRQLPGGTMFIVNALLSVAVVAVVAFSGSWQHQYELSIRLGQAHWVAGMQPLSVEGLIAGATLVIWFAAKYHHGRPWFAYLMLLAAVGQTVLMNLGADRRYDWPWLGPEISVWPAVAFVAGYEMAVWMVRKRAEARTKTPVTAAVHRGRGTGTPPAPDREEPRRVETSRVRPKGPPGPAAATDEDALLAELLSLGGPLPKFAPWAREKTGNARSLPAKRVYDKALAQMNGGPHG
jgi:hypothetical protein